MLDALSVPVEGTVVTVLRAAAEGARDAEAADGASLSDVVTAARDAAVQALAISPDCALAHVVLAELCEAFWGQYPHFFVPALNPTGNSSSPGPFGNANVGLGIGSSTRQQWVMGVQMPLRQLLSEVQARHGFFGAGQDDPTQPGRPCGHIVLKGESCYRCKYAYYQYFSCRRC